MIVPMCSKIDGGDKLCLGRVFKMQQHDMKNCKEKEKSKSKQNDDTV